MAGRCFRQEVCPGPHRRFSGYRIACLLLYPSLWALIIFLITFGLGYGGAIALRPAIQREYFGRNAFGAIQGASIAVMTIGGIIGPAFAGWIFDIRASYQLAWLILAIVTAIAIPLIMAIELPRNQRQVSSSA
ncbi:MFS transporter [Dehalococcoidia bacterium]|nr:MFS transporter [Dehalococcoidia bacterium]